MALNRARSLQVIDPFLSGVARNYKTRVAGFVGEQLLPSIPVSLMSGQYPVFDDTFWFSNDVDNLVADRAPTKEIDYAWSLDTYLCKEYGFKVGWTDLEESQAESALRFRQQKTEFLALRMALAREIRIAACLDTTGNGGQLSAARTTTPAINWDQATATIEENIKAAALDVYDQIGHAPNTLVIPYKLAYAMAVQEDIRLILQYNVTGAGENFLQVGSRVLPAEIHGMRVVIPMGAQKNTANEGAAMSKSEIWGTHARLLYVDPSASWGDPTVGYRITHTPLTTTRWRETDPDLNYLREYERVTEKLVAPDAGHVLRDLL